ncbi:hypothetical protein [Allorhodopirellula solitaria]|nr:hypothetical protein [Allorhodopirellula solitaria]
MDTDKIKDFFIHHAEKMVVGVVIAASVWMIYSGLDLPDMTDEKNPDTLASDAKQVRASIDEDHSDKILPPRQPTFDIAAELKKKNEPIPFEEYVPEHLWVPQNISDTVRRQDPVLLAPRALMTSGHIESYAVLSSSGNYAASTLEPAEKLEKIEQQPVRRPPTRGRRGRGRNAMMEGMDGMGMGMDSGMMGMDGMGMGMDSGMMGMDGMGMDSGMMGMDSGMMGASGMTGAGRAFAPENNFGYSASATSYSQGSTSKKPVPQSAWFIAGTAVIPHKEIAESYQAALAASEGFQPQRDQPLYFNYEIQRADVTDKAVDALVDGDWIKIGDRESDLKRAAFVWAGFAPELVPSDYRDLNVTGYIPPILLSDYSKWALHPLIPLVSRDEIERERFAEEQVTAKEVSAEDMELANPGNLGGGGMGGQMGMYESMGYSSMGMDSDMGMQMGMGVAYGLTTVDPNPVEYKIMRFFDFARGGSKISPMPGHQYVYRIRYAVQDPNFPANPSHQPKSSTLSADVYARVQNLMTKAETTDKRDFQLWSDWSEPSPPASLPSFNKVYAGEIKNSKGREFKIEGKTVEYHKAPPTANIVNENHNIQFASPMPVWLNNATEGSTMSYTGEADLIDPINLQIKKVEDAKVLSGTTIIDLAGGRPLVVVGEDAELMEPGIVLMFDENGGLSVKSEVQDQQKYRIYSFAEERGL